MNIGFDTENKKVVDLNDPSVSKDYATPKQGRFDRLARNSKKASSGATDSAQQEAVGERGGILYASPNRRWNYRLNPPGVEKTPEQEKEEADLMRRLHAVLDNGDSQDVMILDSMSHVQEQVEEAENEGKKLRYRGPKELSHCSQWEVNSGAGYLDPLRPDEDDPPSVSLCDYRESRILCGREPDKDYHKCLLRIIHSQEPEERARTMTEMRLRNAQHDQIRASLLSDSTLEGFDQEQALPGSIQALVQERVHIADERATEAVKEWIKVNKELETLHARYD